MSGCDNSFPLDQYDAYYVDRTCAEKGEKVMYLTFDCGYENGYTEQMLDVLKKHNAKGCFFVTMTYIRDNPDIIKRMKEEGHQVGNTRCIIRACRRRVWRSRKVSLRNVRIS